MQSKKLNLGVIYTNTNCIGCNKCISSCPVVGANVVTQNKESEDYIVMVDPNKCILCGSCINACVHEARTYRDDTDDFFEALEKGAKISVLVSPTLMTDYEKQYYNILGYLKSLGIQHIYNTGFGADLMIWAYMKYMEDEDLSGVISQTCPVIVNYLEKYRPELLKYLVPVHGPAMCTAIYVSDYTDIQDELAYISPCIGSKLEINDANAYGKIKYNVTFERLIKRLSSIDITNFYAEDELSYGLGALVSTTGGLSENVKQYIGFDEVLIQTSGPGNILPYFEHYYKEIVNKSELPFLVDALSCTDGCNFGTGTNCGYEMRNEMAFSAHRAKERAFQSGNVFKAFGYKERLEKLNIRFKELELHSFTRPYEKIIPLERIQLTDEQYEEIYLSMYKYSETQRHTDCGSCGYKTCRGMAYAVGTTLNYKENCINYSKERIRRQTERTNRLLEEIQNINEELMQATQLKSNFLANMSHEIRTPMNAIIGMAEMALRGELPPEEKGYLQQIKASGRSLLAIINDILDFSKIESGKMELSEAPYEVMSIINDTVNMIMTRMKEKNIELLVNAAPDIPIKLMGDDIRIKQILVNLANNAVKFTESGFVEITLNYDRTEDEVDLKIYIRDTGVGIRKEDQEKLFSSFQQVDSKRNRNIEGTGLGLAISREFVKLMGGEIHVESVYGEGSTFWFNIPQKIVVDRPSTQLQQADDNKSASLISKGSTRDSLVKTMDQLNIHHIELSSVSDIYTLSHNVRPSEGHELSGYPEGCCIADHGIKFLFIDYDFWGRELDKFAKENPEIQVVVIIDPRKDIVSASYVRKLNLPIYCLNVATVLNRQADRDYEHELLDSATRFEAPKANILIVDDNAINLTVAKGLLSPVRMNISCASSAREAISLIDENHYDIVFMDHMMPDIDGVEATHMIREKEGDYYRKLPIIALTANAINNAKEMFLQEGMNDFVAKPIDMIDMMAKLRKWLPPEKVQNVGKKETESENVETEDLPVIEGLDVISGVELSGSFKLYKTILADYHEVIEKKADLIETYREERNLGAYTIEVHSLKSASKLIGAMELSKKAEHLEKCGKEQNLEVIDQETPELLRCYRAYIPLLEPYKRCEQSELNDMEKENVDSDVLLEVLSSLCEALDDFDLDTAKSIMEKLNTYLFTEGQSENLTHLSDAVKDMEYDDAIEIAAQWKDEIQN